LGHHYRLSPRDLPGSPDLANKSRRWAIFVHGCYWHHHDNCVRATVPKNNRAWWLRKFEANRDRDQRKIRALQDRGFRVLVVWECELTDLGMLSARLREWLFDGSRET
jgi:DNA mismatch endonuclease (patch repair protein)